MSASIPLVWTNDDICAGTADKLKRQVDFLRPLGIKGVFFVVPLNDNRPLDEDAELLRAIAAAREEGHEFFQHGCRHTPFECGVPETWMLDFAPEVRRRYDAERLEVEKGHTLEALAGMIEAGRRIWRKSFGEDPKGFRPGWGAFCGNLYRALAALGFEWVSSRIVCPTSWLWNQGIWDAPIDFRPEVPLLPHRIEGVLECPIAGDYAFRVPDEPRRVEAMAELGLAEMKHHHRERAPMLICSHWHGLERNGDSGYAVHERMLPRMLESGLVEPMNMSEALAWVERQAEESAGRQG
jgi:peptidoglycan/xylan/chitin deacetylase (PgdA/CDA1 family)